MLSGPHAARRLLGDFARALSPSFPSYFQSAQGERHVGASPALGTRDTPCTYLLTLPTQFSRIIDNTRTFVIEECQLTLIIM